MDNLTKEHRRKNMQAIKATGTGIEKILARALWAKGFRYRKNVKTLVGKPDFVIKKYNIVIFCDSEFWHGKDWGKTVKRIGTNKKYWHSKIERNIKRDKKVNSQLRKEGWTIVRFWGKNIIKNTEKCIAKVEKTIKSHL